MEWPDVAPLASDRVLLEPLTVQHAEEMVDVLSEPELYRYIGGEAASVEQLTRRYALQSAGRSADGSQGWFNCIVRRKDTRDAIGYTQATMEWEGSSMTADIAWVIAPRHQGLNFASEAGAAMCEWLRQNGVAQFVAFIDPDNRSSIGVALNLGMHMTDAIVDGENRWEL